MEITAKANDNNKVWVTVSRVVNLDNYESIRIEAGYSDTLPPKSDPIEIMDEMTNNVLSYVIETAENVKKELKPNLKRRGKYGE